MIRVVGVAVPALPFLLPLSPPAPPCAVRRSIGRLDALILETNKFLYQTHLQNQVGRAGGCTESLPVLSPTGRFPLLPSLSPSLVLPQVLFGAERCELELHQLQLMSTWLTEWDGSGKTAKAAKASGAAAASRASSSSEADALRGARAGPSKPEPEPGGNGKRKATQAAQRRSGPKAAAERAQADRDDDEDGDDDDDMDTGDAEEGEDDDDEEDHEDDDVDMGDAEEDEMDQDDLSGTRVGRDFGTGFFEGTVGRPRLSAPLRPAPRFSPRPARPLSPPTGDRLQRRVLEGPLRRRRRGGPEPR